MSKVYVSKKTEYKDCPIIVRKIGDMFEYLLIYDNDIYSDFVIYKGVWWRRLFPDGHRFTSQEIENLAKILVSGACDTIDKLTGHEAESKES